MIAAAPSPENRGVEPSCASPLKDCPAADGERLAQGLRERGCRLPSADPVSDALAALDEWMGIARAAPSPGGWRLIETAPKDGTPVLLGHSKAAFDGWWQDGEGYNGGNGPGWVDGTTDRYEDNTIFEPTHWMPLPALPVPAEDGA